MGPVGVRYDDEDAVTRFDFRRPSLVSREAVRSLEVAHELFVRRLASRWGATLRALVQAEPIAVDQVPYDDYIRSMPTPNLLATVSLPPLPGVALVEVSPQLAMLLIDRMLGGTGGALSAREDPQRRPTDLEGVLVGDLLGHVVNAVGEALQGLCDRAEMASIDDNPHHVQVAAPSDMVLVLTYRVTLTQGIDTEGLVSVCYPAVTLKPILEELASRMYGGASEGVDPEARTALAGRVDDVDLDLQVCLRDSQIGAADLAGLAVGDVLRLDHRVGQTVRGRVGGADVVEGHVGRRGRRLALQVDRWLHSVPAPVAVKSRAGPPRPAEGSGEDHLPASAPAPPAAAEQPDRSMV